MLPDLPILKRELWEIWLQYLQRQTHANMGVFQQVGRYTSHEGDRLSVIRGDGTVEESEFQRASSEMVMKLDDIANSTPQDRVALLDKIARDMGNQISMHLFEGLNKTLDEAGQIVDGQGRPFDHETILAVIESIQIDFNEFGQHAPLSIVYAPGMTEKVREAFRALENDPSIKARYDELISRKKVEWRDREAARKLVG
ncbi:hypothetical protein [Duganella callida]|uniref:Uncharacterized protein n=1 Tax=Duganella callida TaxID=2561932 RepID=A0A4Y9SRF7_9BURK|nr:hypothetical protein [Duganella callida]TFW27814.1 hypothetical protein E4L98_06345 [Duganella callida]